MTNDYTYLFAILICGLELTKSQFIDLHGFSVALLKSHFSQTTFELDMCTVTLHGYLCFSHNCLSEISGSNINVTQPNNVT